MQEPQQTLPANEEAIRIVPDEEATLITPRFDDEDAVLARPVVPLEEAWTDAASRAAVSRSPYTHLPFAPRRSWMLALVLVSVVVGGLLGGAALYLYQNHSRDEAPAASSTSQPETSVPASGPSPASTTEAVGTSPSAPAQREEHAANASGNKEAGASDSDNKETGAVSARDAENVPAAEQRRETDEGARVGAPKRGKKGERDEEIGRPRRPADNAAGDRQLSRADATPDRRESRRVDTIFYRPRRAARPEGTRRETAGDADRLRRIFEGQPE